VSTKPTNQTTSRRARRAAERRDRFDTARDQRRNRTAASTTSSGWLSTRNLTVGAIGIGVLLIAVLAVSQLGGASSSGPLKDPGVEYPAGIQDGNALGVAGAPVVMEVWGDFQCPICGQHSLNVEPSLVGSYVLPGKLRIVHHDIDILGAGGDESRLPAIGAYCAKEQGKYWNYAHWVFANQQGERQGGFRRDRLIDIAVASGVDKAPFTACLDSQAAADAFNAVQAQAQQAAINQTPTIFLNGTMYKGLISPNDWSTLIEAQLAKASTSPAASAPAASPQASASSAP
jgi:protein-disulfide isomerase